MVICFGYKWVIDILRLSMSKCIIYFTQASLDSIVNPFIHRICLLQLLSLIYYPQQIFKWSSNYTMYTPLTWLCKFSVTLCRYSLFHQRCNKICLYSIYCPLIYDCLLHNQSSSNKIVLNALRTIKCSANYLWSH